MKRIWLTLVAAGLLAIAAFAPVSAQDSVTLDLEEVEGSGVAGNVRIESADGESTVTILLTQGLEDESVHPVHIHEGTCDDLGDVVYPLNNIEDGSSETTIDVDLADLRTGGFAINAHESEENISNFIACANIPAAVGGDVEDDSGDTEDSDDASDEGDDSATDDDGASDEGDSADDSAAEDDDSGSTDGDDAAEDEDGAAEDDESAEDEAAEEDGDDAAEDDGSADEGEEEADDSSDDASEDEAADDSDDQAEDDDEAMDEDEEEQDDVAPATGSTGGVDADTAMMALMVLAGGGLATGMLLRRRASQVQRS